MQKDVAVPTSLYEAADPEWKAIEATWCTLRERESTEHTGPGTKKKF